MTGTGGTSCCPGAGLLPPGDGDRKVRSVMEPLLGVLRRSLDGVLLSRLPAEDTEPLLRRARLDGTSATLMGVVGRALRAAAAAAEDRVVVVAGSLRMKADVAAVAAFGLAVSLVRG
jgi:hypothetical protein